MQNELARDSQEMQLNFQSYRDNFDNRNKENTFDSRNTINLKKKYWE